MLNTKNAARLAVTAGLCAACALGAGPVAVFADEVSVVESAVDQAVPASDAPESSNANALPEAQNGLISLTADVEVSEDELNNLIKESGSVEINLNGHTLKYMGNKSAVIADGCKLTLRNGTVLTPNISSVMSAFNIQTGSCVLIEDVVLATPGSGLYPQGDAANVTVRNSKIYCGVYAVATNAATVSNYNVQIVLENSEFTAGMSGSDACPILVNIPCTITMSACTVNGTRQAVVVRGGTANISNCTINLKDTTGMIPSEFGTGATLFGDASKYLDKDWGSGNEVPMAAVVLGNRAAAYKYPTDVVMTGTTVGTPEGYTAVYAYSNGEAERSVDLVYDAASNVGTVVIPEGSAAKAGKAVVKIGDKIYSSLGSAIADVEDGETITLLSDIPNAEGIAVPSGKNFTIDFAGHTCTAAGPGAGSANTETNLFQFLKDSNITLKNGVIDAVENASANNVKRFIQNYANLTLENMTFNTKNLGENENYALSFNNGNVVFKGDTSINTSSPDIVAFDVCKFGSYPSCSVTFDKTFTGTVGGQIVFDSDDGSSHKLVIDGDGTFAGIKPSGDAAADAAKTGIQITKGTFQAPIDDEWLAPDAVLQKNPDGSYGVHVHEAKHVEAKPATCTEDGNIEHWACSECGLLFEDEGLTEEVAAEDVVVKATGHDVENAVHHEGKAPTVEAEGVVEHWECPACHALFLDAALTKPTTADDVVLPKLDPEPNPDPKPEPGEDEKPGPKPEVKPGEDTAAKGDTLPTTGDASMVAITVSGLAGATALVAAARRRKAE